MEVPSTARILSDRELNARTPGDASLCSPKAWPRTWVLDDDGCGQRNSPPPPDWSLIGAVVDLEN
jgi:hypothetical protein